MFNLFLLRAVNKLTGVYCSCTTISMDHILYKIELVHTIINIITSYRHKFCSMLIINYRHVLTVVQKCENGWGNEQFEVESILDYTVSEVISQLFKKLGLSAKLTVSVVCFIESLF